MDTVTHGLLGATIGALPLPRSLAGAEQGQPAGTDRAALLVGVLAAELPDIDYLLPAGDPVLHTLKAHRGITHALLAAPVVALVAVALTMLVFRRARAGPLYVRALLAVSLAHLLPDLWTGWGTRLLLPLSDRRFALDWTMVVDPFFTGPLLLAAIAAVVLGRRGHGRSGGGRSSRWARVLLVGGAVSLAYLGARVVSAYHLTAVVRAAYPQAASVRVFPAPLAVSRWRYVARLDDGFAAGSLALGRGPEEQARHAALPTGPVPDDLAAIPTVREALLWARFPVVRVRPTHDGGRSIEIADLRYHLRGQATLTVVVQVDRGGAVTEARLDRGGSAGQLLRRWRGVDADAGGD